MIDGTNPKYFNCSFFNMSVNKYCAARGCMCI